MSPVANEHHIIPSDRAAFAVITCGVALTWTLLVFLVRMHLRFYVKGPFGLDDAVSTLGTVIAAGQTTATFLTLRNGLGKREDFPASQTLDEKLLQSAYAAALLYILAIWASKCSTSLFIARLTRLKQHLIAIHTVTGFTTVWGIAATFLVGIPPWNSETRVDNYTCNLLTRWIVVESFSMFIEVMLVALSIYLVWGLSMHFKTKAVVVGAFSCRLLILIPTGFRLHYLRKTLSTSNKVYDSIDGVIATQIVMHFSLMAATLPCLKQFLRAFDTNLGGTVKIRERTSERSENKGGSYAMQSVDRGRSISGATHNVAEIKYDSSCEAKVEAKSIELNGWAKSSIRKTQAWDVVYELRE